MKNYRSRLLRVNLKEENYFEIVLKYKIEPKTNFWEFAEANLDRRFSGSFAYVCPYDTFIRVQYQHVVARIEIQLLF